MADPKYSSLPGIDHSQPDVYETSDLPEADQSFQPTEGDGHESVENIHIDSSAAFDKFKGKSLGHKTDFGQPTEYELAGDDLTKETPEQKYQRLWLDLTQLSEDINIIKEGAKEDSASTQCLTRAHLLKQAENVKNEIEELNLGKQLGIQGGVNLSDPQGVIQKRLLSELERFKYVDADKTPSGKRKSISAASGDTDHVNYQLFYRPDQAKFDNTARYADLEKRLERLETVVGKPLDRSTPLTSDVANKSLLGAVSALSVKTKLMEKETLEDVESRLASINSQMDQLSEKKVNLEQREKLNKISELYSLMMKWNSLSDSLPEIVGRLSALKGLHEQALEFSQILGHLNVTQQQINVQLKVHTDLLKQVQTDFGKNLALIQTNCEKLGSRLENLNK